MKRYLGHLRILIAPNVGFQIDVAEGLSDLLLAFRGRRHHVLRVAQSFALAVHARPQSRLLLHGGSAPRLESLRRDLLAAFHHRFQLQQAEKNGLILPEFETLSFVYEPVPSYTQRVAA